MVIEEKAFVGRTQRAHKDNNDLSILRRTAKVAGGRYLNGLTA
jgi:hypothetical protein